ncbi:hypothetical protein GJ744_001698 [Endocarpon pusillum]|uniref:Terpene synthase n=1 Tax=Endocarpon pusillum TaxID=364733 RepID=A0A8H7ACX8_9EURO|nr:hypothetical protein GJ744_001698 [Endocarpon pusillum]
MVNRKLESCVSDEKIITELKKADFALGAASIWPRAAWDEYLVLTYLMLLVFVWDDEIDMPAAPLASDFQAAESFRRETMSFVKNSLGFGEKGVLPRSRNATISVFELISGPLRKVYTRDQLASFLHELTFSLEMSKVEQEYSLSDRIPTISEYWAFRMGTSGVGAFLAMAEYSIRSRLPRPIINSPEMKVIWDETNLMSSLINDILSVKKEVVAGSILGLVPLLCMQNPDAQAAIDSAVKALHDSVKRFRTAEGQLLRRTARDPKTQENLSNYINVCKENVTGFLNWCSRTPRYARPFESITLRSRAGWEEHAVI